MTNRREFLAHTAGSLGVLALGAGALRAHHPLTTHWMSADPSLAGRLGAGDGAEAARLAGDERFWARVRRGYALHADVVNLDHGWTSPTPRAALDTLVRDARDLQALPADRLARLWPEVTDTHVRAALAAAMGVPPAEIALVRNATEAIDTVLLGVPLRAGDEIVCSAHDYYAMLDALEQRQRRDGVVLRVLRPPVPVPSFDALAEMYEAAIGPRTRLVLLTHPSNLTGQLLPVRRIAAAAHAAGAEVVLDGAQSLGLHEESIADFGCDYYGASAHKWLGVPVGLGMLWMKPEHVAKVWPLVPPPPRAMGMARFEWIGTAPEYVGPAALPALAVHGAIGPARKAARLRYLTRYWRTRAAEALPQARFYTLPDAETSIGLCTVELPGVDAGALQQRLLSRDRVLVQAMSGNARTPEIRGVRVSPNVFTTPAELDRLVRALAAAALDPALSA